MARGRELRLGGEEGKKRGRMAGRLAWLAPQPPRDHAPGAPLGQVEEGSWSELSTKIATVIDSVRRSLQTNYDSYGTPSECAERIGLTQGAASRYIMTVSSDEKNNEASIMGVGTSSADDYERD